MAEAVAALRVAGLLLSPIISKLADKASAYFGGDVTAEKLQDLKTFFLPKIQTVIQAAEMIPLDQLRPWLMELKAATYEAEDVLDEYEYRRLKDQVSGLPSALRPITQPLNRFGNRAKKCMAPTIPKTKLSKSLDRLEKVASRVDEFINLLRLHSDSRNNPNIGGTSSIITTSDAGMRRETTNKMRPTTSSPPPAVFGRDKECDTLISLLVSVCDEHESRSRDWSIPVLAVCGIGWSGKSTVVQCVYNDERIIEHFDMRMWVHLSRKFDVAAITREIIESAIRGECFHVGNLDTLQSELKKGLNARKFLLVSDDVWCDEPVERLQWDQLLVPLNEVVDRGSRIIITTRMEVVASVLGAKSFVTLKELEAKDCRSIVKYHAFGDSRKAINDAELVEVVEQIVGKLKNSPLEAKMVGIQLGRKVSLDAWRMILKGDMLRSTRDVLLRSFEHLPPHLR